MADTPEVPDLKKALENKPAGFSWTPGSTVAKAAASAAPAPGRSRPQSARERLLALGPGKLSLIALAFLVLGGLAFSFAAVRFGGTADGGGASLGNVASSMKIRFARQNDPTGFIKRESAFAAGEKMRFDLIKGAADKAPGDAAGGVGGVPGGNGEGGEPMNPENGAASRAGASAGGGAAGPGQGGDLGGSGGLSGGAPPRLNASASSIKFQGMRRVSGTAGFRSIQGGRGGVSRTIRTKGSSANPYGTASGADGSTGGTALSGGKASGATGVSPGRVAGDGAGAGSAAAGGGGGGGGPAVDMDALESTVDAPSQIQNLLTDAGKLREKAEDEKKKAQALKAGGHDVQAAYHYDRYQKAKDAAKEKEAEAARLTSEMENAAGSIIEQPNTAP
jgi:hypothetical protein